jgi:hypothetical protein
MKNTLMCILVIFITYPCYAQWSANGENIYTTNTGNVGIGISNPAYKLFVNGNSYPLAIINGGVNGSSANGETSIYLGDASSGIQMLKATKKTFNTRAFQIWSEYGYNVASLAAEFYRDYIKFFTADLPRFTINTQGNVGIGTSTPSSRLVVATDSYNGSIDETIGVAQANGVTSFGGYMGQRVVSANTRQGLIVSGTGSLTLNASSYNIDFINGVINPTTDANLTMRIGSNGNVGIGTPTPDSKLAVAGTIHSKSVRVDVDAASWPDYVFEDHYKLAPLEEVKDYIQLNHHLQDIPTAKEIEKGGLDVGDIIKIQTKKIEELTLYLIEKDMKEKQHEQKFIEQQREIDSLKETLKTLLNESKRTNLQ